MNGTLYGLGVGPGDPDLITLKAIKVLKNAPVVAYPAPEIGESLARAIAAPHIPVGCKEITIRTPMISGDFPSNNVYDHYAVIIADVLDGGNDVALLCEGDPFLYGSFMYLFARLSKNYQTEVVPGVSSLGACAAVAGVPLVSRNQVLAILPGPLEERELERRIKGSEAVSIMKVGRHLPKIVRILDRLGLLNDAQYIERATMVDQRVLPLRKVKHEYVPYFSMILVRRGEEGTGV